MAADKILKEFKINKYLTVKLIDLGTSKKTYVFVNNDLFLQCAYILLNIDKTDDEIYEKLESFNSIDEAADILDSTLEKPSQNDIKIPAKTLFWAHCSNLQAWAENNYNTRILHRNLAFPLLKKLADVGDPIAIQRFKEQIAERFMEGNDSVQKFLLHEGYMEYISKEEFKAMTLNEDTYNQLIQKVQETKILRRHVPYAYTLVSNGATNYEMSNIEDEMPDK